MNTWQTQLDNIKILLEDKMKKKIECNKQLTNSDN